MQFFGLVCPIITDNLNILLAFKHAINAKRYKEVLWWLLKIYIMK